MALKYKIVLEDSHVRWFCSKQTSRQPRIYGRGYAFISDKYYYGQKLVDYVLRQCQSVPAEDLLDTLMDLTRVLNGCWAIVIEWRDSRIIAAVDRSRSIPLFYARTADGYVFASSTNDIAAHLGDLEIDDVSAASVSSKWLCLRSENII